jgi:hypothetical protein
VRLLPYLAWSDLLAADIPDPTFHLEGWIPTRGLGFLVGDSEAFKTWWALYLSVCKAKGVPMFDQIPTRQGPVLFVSEENGVVEDKRRAVALARGMGFDQPLPLYVVSDAGFNFDDEAAYARLKATVVELSITLVVVDSLVRVHRRKENASDEMNALYQDRVKPIIAMGADIMFLHHRRKSPQGLRPTSPSENDEMRGSGDLRAAAHYAIFLKALADGLVSVSPNKTRGFRKPTPYVFAIKDADHGGIVFTHEGAPKEALDKTEPCKAAVLEYVAVEMHGTATRASILAKFKGTYSKKLIDPVLKALAEKSYPLKKEKVGRDTLYHLVLAASEDELEPGSNDVPF